MGKHCLLLPVLLAFLAGASPAHAWTWPASGPVLQHFGYGGEPYAAGQHRGADVGGSAGEPVLAPAAGSVTFAGTVPSGGRTITIRTPDGLAVTLLHLGTITEVEGASVAEGAQVGTLGSSGVSEWAQPYVHLGIRKASDEAGYLDPESFLPPRASASATAADVEAAEPTPSEATAADQAEPSGQASPQAPTPVSEPAGGQSPAGTHAPAPGAVTSPSSSSNVGGFHVPEPGAREPTVARTPETSVWSQAGS
ncbi:MAG TPA: peptidoglycan DD-metalloendopeptidase family protein, partial [Gaiellaceae bacterium]|nr:peptidoglycan DD-metalloendopeptidase family protein [Gaiellaceae bacterium]